MNARVVTGAPTALGPLTALPAVSSAGGPSGTGAQTVVPPKHQDACTGVLVPLAHTGSATDR